MRVALVVILASLLILIGWISMRMARDPDPQRRTARRGKFIPHDGGGGNGHHGDGNGGGNGGDN